MRPWLIAAAHAGYVARPPGDALNMKCNITILQLTRTAPGFPIAERKIWHFYNCVPLNLATRNLSYDAEAVETYDVSFIYDQYGVATGIWVINSPTTLL